VREWRKENGMISQVVIRVPFTLLGGVMILLGMVLVLYPMVKNFTANLPVVVGSMILGLVGAGFGAWIIFFAPGLFK
jgi:hypothetical protein